VLKRSILIPFMFFAFSILDRVAWLPGQPKLLIYRY
jgi:hypothetical protein